MLVVGGGYANFSNQTRKAAKPSVASEIAAHQVKREIAKGRFRFSSEAVQCFVASEIAAHQVKREIAKGFETFKGNGLVLRSK